MAPVKVRCLQYSAVVAIHTAPMPPMNSAIGMIEFQARIPLALHVEKDDVAGLGLLEPAARLGV